MSIGTEEERTLRLSNSLRCAVPGVPAWAILLAENESEARRIVLNTLRETNISRMRVGLSEYTGPRPNGLYRFRVNVNV